MVNKKYYLLLAGICTALASQPAFAQESQAQNAQNQTNSGIQWSSRDMTYRGQNYDVLDSNYYPKYRMAQHRKFINHQYMFPPKPRNMWEVGGGLGIYNVGGDVPTLMPWQTKGLSGGYGFDLHVRKSWGYLISTRLSYDYGIAEGLQWQPAHNFAYNPAWSSTNATGGPKGTGGLYKPTLPNGTGSYTTGDPVFYNYRMEAHQLTLDLMFSTNNIKFHRAHTGVSLYGFVGAGFLAYNTLINTADANGNAYTALYNAVIAKYGGTNYSDHNAIRKALQNGLDGIPGMDKTYETQADNSRTKRKPTIFNNKTLDWAPSVGGGAQFRLSKRVNLYVEDRLTIPDNDDLLDGQRWAEQVPGSPVLSQSYDILNQLTVGVNFNLGNAKKNVEPLYWVNPLDWAYNELSNPRHMVLPEPILPDSDGDGVTDQFDKCPGTPAGVAVDVHGCPMDTDGDGVPDYKDKQLITPTECQPVDADGVGKCPCPEGCGSGTSACGNIGAGSIIFSKNSAHISAGMQAQLATLAAQMQANPTCKVVITGAGNGSKLQQQRSWDRVNAVIEFMSEKNNIDRNRFIFQYGQAGDPNTVMYRSAMNGEEGPTNVAPPFPNLRRE